jgi:predicted nucleic acid-binding protein
VRIVDLNVLLYAVNRDATHHERVLDWWEGAMNGTSP